jgi:hypothetical protein
MRIILIVLFAAPLFGLAQQKNFIISGKLKGLPDKTELYLKNEESGPDPIATAISDGENFVLKGSVSEPGLYQISAKNNQQKLIIFLDLGNISLEGDFLNLQTAKIAGSSSHDDFMAFDNVGSTT